MSNTTKLKVTNQWGRKMFDKTDGDQLVIPGAERISTKAHLVRLAEKPLQARRGQIGLRGTGLFGSRV